jgi:ribonuclease-3
LFEVECEIPELGIRTRGEGTSRRSAEQEAARAAYEQASDAPDGVQGRET